ncbi:hypothetical protein [Methylophaga sp. OBS1]|uniref:hypothetical protein n=1 Tax=Methylophaga sp. OBS1 TaxID=2991933 RepID=UPI002251B124|nr:hypothetical protein [Methylophaga sp. OBS1]MCX4190901.1 hypothetical protein [Methylophaga sp. OBS1]MCX4192152.1 hypothetical protein [Methylophaga sp. OBS1]
MASEEEFNPIKSPLYIRQRKTLLTVTIIIIAINLIGGEIQTDTNGSSSLTLPFGVSFQIARPWLIDWLLVAALIYLVIRYFIFSTHVRQRVRVYRERAQRNWIPRLVDTTSKDKLDPNHVSVKSRLWLWRYSRGEYNAGNYEEVVVDEKINALKTLLPSVLVELELLWTKNAYSDYYSPYLMTALAIISYTAKSCI